MTLYCDTHEPVAAFTSIQQAVPAALTNLNDQRWADYMWKDYSGKAVHIERKQWGELTNGVEKIEYQLREEQAAHKDARLGLIVEGIATPSVLGTQLWAPSKATKKSVWYATREQSTRYSLLMAWLYQVEKFIEVHYTATLEGTCQALVAFYKSDQKEEHSTFHRHLHSFNWKPNPQVEMLMSIGHGIGIGATKAEALITQYGTVWNLLNKTPVELAKTGGVGVHLATRLLRKVGRSDI